MTNGLFPAFSKNNIPVAFAVTDNYVPYFGVCLWSVIRCSSTSNNYDIVVLDGGISIENKRRLQRILPKNFSIRYVDMIKYMEHIDKKQFYLSGHITLSTYYRFFIPQIFENYKKILYLDSDLTVVEDIANLYNQNIGKCILGAALDTSMCAFVKSREKFLPYARDIMKLPAPYYCFNAGVLICNIEQMKKFDFTNSCIKRLNEIKKTWSWDQDILNSLYAQQYFQLNQAWNTQWYAAFDAQLKNHVTDEIYESYQSALQKPKIVHYTSSNKAWNTPDRYLAEYFWQNAKESPFYEEILCLNIQSKEMQIPQELQNACGYQILRNFYLKYKLKLIVAPAGKVEIYKHNKKKYKEKIKLAKPYLNNKKATISFRWVFNKTKLSNGAVIKFLGLKIYERKKTKDVTKIYWLGIPAIKKDLYQNIILGIPFVKNQKDQIETLTKRLKSTQDSFKEFQEDTANYIEELKYKTQINKKSLAKIFCTYHYQDNIPIFKSDVYEPIQTGAVDADYDFGILKDNTGDNISDKNNFYAELTATYWVWKNWMDKHPEVEYIGADHHYSHLDWTRKHPLQRQGCSIYKVNLPKFLDEFKSYNSEYINFEPYDIILPKKLKYSQINQTLLGQYLQHHPLEQYELFEKIVAEFHPECKALLPKLRNLQDFYLGNSYAMRRELFDDYCQWMFPMLFELEKRSNGFEKYKNFPPKRRRMPPFLSERFINLWLIQKQQSKPLKIGERTWLIIPQEK